MTLVEMARKLRPLIEQAAASLDDKTASEGVMLFPALKQGGALVKAGTRVNWRGKLKRAAVDLWDTEANSPENAPALWEDISYRDGYRIIPDTITAGLAFAKDECGWWGDVLMRSKIAANAWNPTQYADGWEIVER